MIKTEDKRTIGVFEENWEYVKPYAAATLVNSSNLTQNRWSVPGVNACQISRGLNLYVLYGLDFTMIDCTYREY